jgi:N-acetyl-gamma-glutamyl-phosphate reductase
MEMAIGAAAGVEPDIVFTPHLVPMQRGLLSTCYARVVGGAGEQQLVEALRDAYDDAGFVHVVDGPPQTRWTVGSNNCLISVNLDERTGIAVVLAALDNLLKGAAGQAVQCANLMLRLDEAMGLSGAGWLP